MHINIILTVHIYVGVVLDTLICNNSSAAVNLTWHRSQSNSCRATTADTDMWLLSWTQEPHRLHSHVHLQFIKTPQAGPSAAPAILLLHYDLRENVQVQLSGLKLPVYDCIMMPSVLPHFRFFLLGDLEIRSLSWNGALVNVNADIYKKSSHSTGMKESVMKQK